VFVEGLVPDDDVLHAEQLAEAGEHALAVDGETKPTGVHVRSAHPGEDHDGFPGRHRIGVERHRPFAVRRLDLVRLECAAGDESSADVGSQLPPDLGLARTKPPAQRSHPSSMKCDNRAFGGTMIRNVVALAFALASVLADPANVAGKWNAAMQLETITGHPVLTFKQDGEKLTG